MNGDVMEYGNRLSGIGQANSAPSVQQQYGVASGYKDLSAAVEQIVNTVDNLRSGMGISVPKSSVEVANESPTIATQLRLLARILGNANADLTDVLMHLNS